MADTGHKIRIVPNYVWYCQIRTVVGYIARTMPYLSVTISHCYCCSEPLLSTVSASTPNQFTTKAGPSLITTCPVPTQLPSQTCTIITILRFLPEIPHPTPCRAPLGNWWHGSHGVQHPPLDLLSIQATAGTGPYPAAAHHAAEHNQRPGDAA